MMQFRFFPYLALFGRFCVGSQMQYCRVDVEQKLDFCATLSSFHNISSQTNDLYIRTSTKFNQRMGWSALGIGDTMSEALMFIFYPGVHEGGKHEYFGLTHIMLIRTAKDATVSLRTTRYGSVSEDGIGIH